MKEDVADVDEFSFSQGTSDQESNGSGSYYIKQEPWGHKVGMYSDKLFREGPVRIGTIELSVRPMPRAFYGIRMRRGLLILLMGKMWPHNLSIFTTEVLE